VRERLLLAQDLQDQPERGHHQARPERQGDKRRPYDSAKASVFPGSGEIFRCARTGRLTSHWYSTSGKLLHCGSNTNKAKPVSYAPPIHAEFTGVCVHRLVDTESNPESSQRALDLEQERSRQLLDAQARAWASAARKWIWVFAIAALTATAACVGFLLH
jgi:hypothetical protein